MVRRNDGRFGKLRDRPQNLRVTIFKAAASWPRIGLFGLDLLELARAVAALDVPGRLIEAVLGSGRG
jgi:hypothetical protein